MRALSDRCPNRRMDLAVQSFFLIMGVRESEPVRKVAKFSPTKPEFWPPYTSLAD